MTCRVNVNAGQPWPDSLPGPCGKPAIYRAWTANCHLCRVTGLPGCAGHPVCLEHGAALRTVSLPDASEEVELLRICTLAGARPDAPVLEGTVVRVVTDGGTL